MLVDQAGHRAAARPQAIVDAAKRVLAALLLTSGRGRTSSAILLLFLLALARLARVSVERADGRRVATLGIGIGGGRLLLLLHLPEGWLRDRRRDGSSVHTATR